MSGFRTTQAIELVEGPDDALAARLEAEIVAFSSTPRGSATPATSPRRST
jgi:hypothetical protein